MPCWVCSPHRHTLITKLSHVWPTHAQSSQCTPLTIMDISVLAGISSLIQDASSNATDHPNMPALCEYYQQLAGVISPAPRSIDKASSSTGSFRVEPVITQLSPLLYSPKSMGAQSGEATCSASRLLVLPKPPPAAGQLSLPGTFSSTDRAAHPSPPTASSTSSSHVSREWSSTARARAGTAEDGLPLNWPASGGVPRVAVYDLTREPALVVFSDSSCTASSSSSSEAPTTPPSAPVARSRPQPSKPLAPRSRTAAAPSLQSSRTTTPQPSASMRTPAKLAKSTAENVAADVLAAMGLQIVKRQRRFALMWRGDDEARASVVAYAACKPDLEAAAARLAPAWAANADPDTRAACILQGSVIVAHPWLLPTVMRAAAPPQQRSPQLLPPSDARPGHYSIVPQSGWFVVCVMNKKGRLVRLGQSTSLASAEAAAQALIAWHHSATSQQRCPACFTARNIVLQHANAQAMLAALPPEALVHMFQSQPSLPFVTSVPATLLPKCLAGSSPGRPSAALQRALSAQCEAGLDPGELTSDGALSAGPPPMALPSWTPRPSVTSVPSRDWPRSAVQTGHKRARSAADT